MDRESVRDRPLDDAESRNVVLPFPPTLPHHSLPSNPPTSREIHENPNPAFVPRAFPSNEPREGAEQHSSSILIDFQALKLPGTVRNFDFPAEIEKNQGIHEARAGETDGSYGNGFEGVGIVGKQGGFVVGSRGVVKNALYDQKKNGFREVGEGVGVAGVDDFEDVLVTKLEVDLGRPGGPERKDEAGNGTENTKIVKKEDFSTVRGDLGVEKLNDFGGDMGKIGGLKLEGPERSKSEDGGGKWTGNGVDFKLKGPGKQDEDWKWIRYQAEFGLGGVGNPGEMTGRMGVKPVGYGSHSVGKSSGDGHQDGDYKLSRNDDQAAAAKPQMSKSVIATNVPMDGNRGAGSRQTNAKLSPATSVSVDLNRTATARLQSGGKSYVDDNQGAAGRALTDGTPRGKNVQMMNNSNSRGKSEIHQYGGDVRLQQRGHNSTTGAKHVKTGGRHSQNHHYPPHYHTSDSSSSSRYYSKQPKKPSTPLSLRAFCFALNQQFELWEFAFKDLEKTELPDVWRNTSLLSLRPDVEVICPICLDQVKLGKALPCGHVFCGVCVFRCLFAAEANPLLQKCPMCEGRLFQQDLRRCQVVIASSLQQANEFRLVRAIPKHVRELKKPIAMDDPEAVFSTFTFATGEGMCGYLDREREEMKFVRDELRRYRDSDGLIILNMLERDLDDEFVQWKRLCGKRRHQRSGATIEAEPQPAPQPLWYYQRGDGSRAFLHPINNKSLLQFAQDDVTRLPGVIQSEVVLEIEDWSNRGPKLKHFLPGLASMDIAENATLKLIELDLSAQVNLQALEVVRKEADERTKRRFEREQRAESLVMQEARKQMQAEETRRKVREDEQKQLDAFFGFDKARREEMERLAKESPTLRPIDSFSSIVSNMGHFPELGKAATMTAEHFPELGKSSSGSGGGSITTGMLSVPGNTRKAGWGMQQPQQQQQQHQKQSQQQQRQSQLSPNQASFAQATTTKGNGKKMLWSNNPASRSSLM